MLLITMLNLVCLSNNKQKKEKKKMLASRTDNRFGFGCKIEHEAAV